ncbi:hypothetical protein ARMSODRAFT_129798 [Armillaria solidipes]|uniref:Uncharacterized protein n=1 Tax=Armillaria solidipes TaxID=1076256 RepID=A0A2H3BMQ4_9AGAR|nr:hypothetical protein ARMSODRAFT_129798 [Armillaria solidipes]
MPSRIWARRCITLLQVRCRDSVVDIRDPGGWVQMGFVYGKSLVQEITVAHSRYIRGSCHFFFWCGTRIQAPFKSIRMTSIPMGQDPAS